MNDPFSTSPSPASLFLTPGLKSAIHKTKYTIDRRQGLTCILGDVGMGKSSILRLLYGDYAAQDEAIASFIPTPSFKSDFAFLRSICQDFGLPARRSLYEQEQELRAFLIEQTQQGKNVVVFLDEAQRLDNKMLELVRAMLNFETNTMKLIQIVLCGQIELRDRLREPSKKAIRSRIFAPSVLDPLSLGETRAMIKHRCEIVEIDVPFTDDAVQQIYDISAGVPREILKLCAVSYELARLNGSSVVSVELLNEAVPEAAL